MWAMSMNKNANLNLVVRIWMVRGEKKTTKSKEDTDWSVIHGCYVTCEVLKFLATTLGLIVVVLGDSIGRDEG